MGGDYHWYRQDANGDGLTNKAWVQLDLEEKIPSPHRLS